MMPEKNKNNNKRLLRKPRVSKRPLPTTIVTDDVDVPEVFTFIDGSLDYDFIHNDDEQIPALELDLNDEQTPREGKQLYNSWKSALDFQKNFMVESALSTAVQPRKPRGPPYFPCRPVHRTANLLYDLLWDEEDNYYLTAPPFTLHDFLHHVSTCGKIPIATVKETMLSSHNYKKLTKLLSEHNARNEDNTLKKIDLHEQFESLPPVRNRVPNRNLLLEMAAMVKEQIKENLDINVTAVIKPLRKYTAPYFPGEGSITEIVIYDYGGVSPTKSLTLRGSHMQGSRSVTEGLLQSASPHYLQGVGRSHSPFVNQEFADLSLAEVCLLDSLANGGAALSLKALFLSTLPDLSPVFKTLTYLNLSFNDFKTFPNEVLSCRQLTVLKLRNNPLREIPEDIKILSCLRTLVTSYCLLTTVPTSLFSLKNLIHLDVSYNRLTFLPKEIKNARLLAELNVEGNSLNAMPCATLKLQSLKYLRVKNNFMHPLIWCEATKNEPQRLVDMAALVISELATVNYSDILDDKCSSIMEDYASCDCCPRRRYGAGIRIIRPCMKIFGVKHLPFLFNACSPKCALDFMKGSDNIAHQIYL